MSPECQSPQCQNRVSPTRRLLKPLCAFCKSLLCMTIVFENLRDRICFRICVPVFMGSVICLGPLLT